MDGQEKRATGKKIRRGVATVLAQVRHAQRAILRHKAQIQAKLAQMQATLQERLGPIKRYISYGDLPPKALHVEPETCLNCGETIGGRFCANCGQSLRKNRLRHSDSMRRLFYAFTNMDRRFYRSIKELFIRPGYMIRDYIAGKRERYLHPFELLFIVSAIYYILSQMMGVKLEGDAGFTSFRFSWDHLQLSPSLKAPLEFMYSAWRKSLALQILTMLPLYVLSGRWSFRAKSRKQGLGWTEWTILQSYILSAVSVLSIFALLLFGKHDGNDRFDAPVLWILLIQIYAYKQLFGYGFWATLWRVLRQYFILFLLLLCSITSIALLLKFGAMLFGLTID